MVHFIVPVDAAVEQLLSRHAKAVVELEGIISQQKVGDRLIPERDLSVLLKVSRETVRKAINTLSRQGVLESKQGRGTFIRRPTVSAPVRRRATKLVGIAVPSVEIPEIARIVSGAESRAGQSGYRVVLAHDHDDADRQISIIRQMLDDDLDGLIIYPDRANVMRPAYLSTIKDVVAKKKPVVLLDRYVSTLPVPCVLTDSVRGLYQATEHLILCGRRRLALISFGEGGGSSERDRLLGFRNALRDYGLPAEPVLHAPLGYEQDSEILARKAVAKWLADAGPSLPFDAIVCFHDAMAYGAYLALRDAGLRVPNDVALVGYDNFDREAFRAAGLHLTSVEQPYAEIGRAGMDLLLKRISGAENEGPNHVLLAPKLIVRSSCGAADVTVEPQ